MGIDRRLDNLRTGFNVDDPTQTVRDTGWNEK